MDGEFEVLDEGAVEESSEVTPEGLDNESDGPEGGVDRGAAERVSGEDGQDDGAEQKDGRYGTKDFKAHLAKIKEVDPQAAKAFERAYWKVQGVDKLGTTQELTAIKEAVELHGGVEGIIKLAESVENYAQLEKGFEKGDPKVIEGWAADYPDGFKRLVPAALDKLAQIDGERYAQVGSGVTDKLFQDFGVFQRIAQLGDALSSGKVEDAVAHYNVLTKFLSDMKGLAKGLKDNPYKAREEELDSREREIGERDKKAFYGTVRSDVNSQVGRAMNQEIAKLLRGKRMGTEQGNRVRGQITEELKRLINTGDYPKRYEAVMGQRDRDKAIQFIVSNANRNMSKAVQTVLKDFNLLGGTGASRAGSTQRVARPASSSVPATVAGRPKISDVDFGKTDKATFLGSRSHGTAWLRSGKQARW